MYSVDRIQHASPARREHRAGSMAIFFFLASVLCLDANAQSTDFTFQGHLTDNGDLANALYDFRFELFDADTNGASLGIGTRPA
jgi:hypothetical protein